MSWVTDENNKDYLLEGWNVAYIIHKPEDDWRAIILRMKHDDGRDAVLKYSRYEHEEYSNTVERDIRLWKRIVHKNKHVIQPPKGVKAENAYGESKKYGYFMLVEHLELIAWYHKHQMETEDVKKMIHDITQVIDILHTDCYVHTDIHPGNIGFNGDHFVLFDFNNWGYLDCTAVRCGLTRYMSPELCFASESLSYDFTKRTDYDAFIFCVIDLAKELKPLAEEYDCPFLTDIKNKDEESIQKYYNNLSEKKVSILTKAKIKMRDLGIPDSWLY